MFSCFIIHCMVDFFLFLFLLKNVTLNGAALMSQYISQAPSNATPEHLSVLSLESHYGFHHSAPIPCTFPALQISYYSCA